MSAPRRARGIGVVAIAAILVGAIAAPAFAVPPRASLPDIEDEVMCTVCGVPLNIAESPQADRERVFIRALIAKGETKAQIKRALAQQFGPAVLALPQRNGFSLAAYAVPIVAVLAALAALVMLVPRWRRRPVLRVEDAPRPELSPADARRLEEDLDRYEL